MYIYNETTCQQPDRFKLMVAANGIIVPADAVGQKYLMTRHNLRKTKLEIAESAVPIEEQLIARLRSFTSLPCTLGGDEGENSGSDNTSGNNGSGESGDNSGDNNEENGLYCGGKYDNKYINCIIALSKYYNNVEAYSNGRITGPVIVWDQEENQNKITQGDIKLEPDKIAHLFFLTKPADTEINIIIGYSRYSMMSYNDRYSFFPNQDYDTLYSFFLHT